MTDSNETPTAQTSEAPADAPAQARETSREAARYRTRLREAEAQRDALAARIDALQRAEVERQAAHLDKPSAIWATGLDLDTLRDDDGNLDAEAVTTAIESATEELGLGRKPSNYVRGEGNNPHPFTRSSDMASLLRGM